MTLSQNIYSAIRMCRVYMDYFSFFRDNFEVMCMVLYVIVKGSNNLINHTFASTYVARELPVMPTVFREANDEYFFLSNAGLIQIKIMRSDWLFGCTTTHVSLVLKQATHP